MHLIGFDKKEVNFCELYGKCNPGIKESLLNLGLTSSLQACNIERQLLVLSCFDYFKLLWEGTLFLNLAYQEVLSLRQYFPLLRTFAERCKEQEPHMFVVMKTGHKLIAKIGWVFLWFSVKQETTKTKFFKPPIEFVSFNQHFEDCQHWKNCSGSLFSSLKV